MMENPIFRSQNQVLECFLIKAHSLRDFGGRGIGLAKETNIYQKQCQYLRRVNIRKSSGVDEENNESFEEENVEKIWKRRYGCGKRDARKGCYFKSKIKLLNFWYFNSVYLDFICNLFWIQNYNIEQISCRWQMSVNMCWQYKRVPNPAKSLD